MAKSSEHNLIALYERFTANSESPALFHIWSLLTAVGAIMGRECFLQIGAKSKRQYPRLYTVLVAAAGMRKSAAIGEIAQFLIDDALVPLASNSSSREALIDFAVSVERMGVDPDNPEAETAHNSFLLLSGELSVFLKSKKDNQDMISLLNDWYDCKSMWSHATVSRGKQEVAGVFMPLLAATTQDSLAQSLDMDALETGIASRLLFVVSRDPVKRIAMDYQTDDQKWAEKAVRRRLRKIAQFYHGEMKFSDSAYKFYVEWYAEPGTRYSRGLTHPRMQQYLQRKQNHFFALAMICQACMPGKLTYEISRAAAELAVLLLEQIEPNMIWAYESAGRDKVGMFANKLLRYLMQAGVSVTRRRALTYFYADVSEKEFNEALALLVQLRKVSIDDGRISVREKKGARV